MPTGFVALPSSALLQSAPNSVAVVCSSSSMGVNLPDGLEHELIAVIDRSDPVVTGEEPFSPQDFYAFRDAEGMVQIRWVEVASPPLSARARARARTHTRTRARARARAPATPAAAILADAHAPTFSRALPAINQLLINC